LAGSYSLTLDDLFVAIRRFGWLLLALLGNASGA
jgi:hypothetical protein